VVHPKKIWDPLLISATAEASNFKFGIQNWLGAILQNQRLEPKLAGAWAREASKKNYDPLFISVTVEAND